MDIESVISRFKAARADPKEQPPTRREVFQIIQELDREGSLDRMDPERFGYVRGNAWSVFKSKHLGLKRLSKIDWDLIDKHCPYVGLNTIYEIALDTIPDTRTARIWVVIRKLKK